MSAESTVKLVAKCYCGANSFVTEVPLSTFPLRLSICHCSACRTTSGTYFATNMPWHGSRPFDETSFPDTLSRYTSANIAAHYFCSTCSSQMFLHYGGADNTSDRDIPEEWNVNSGCVEIQGELPEGKTLYKLYQQIWLDDTTDEGLHKQICNESRFGEVPVYCSAGGMRLASMQDIERMKTFEPSALSNKNDKLEAKCRCGSVKLLLERPLSEQCYPPHSLSPDTDSFDPPHHLAKDAWWIRPSLYNKTKRDRFLAASCACTSCCKIAGTDVVQWLFIPTCCVTIVHDGKEYPWPQDNDIDKLAKEQGIAESIGIKTYNSSKDVTRGFCKTCGANIYWSSPHRTNMIDIAAGLVSHLGDGVGSRRDEWIDWNTKYVSFTEDAKGRGDLIDRICEGLKWNYTQEEKNA